MFILTFKIRLSRIQYEIRYLILDSYESNVRHAKVIIMYHSQSTRMMNHYRMHNVNMIQSHHGRYSSFRVVACVIRPIRSLSHFNIPKVQQ